MILITVKNLKGKISIIDNEINLIYCCKHKCIVFLSLTVNPKL